MSVYAEKSTRQLLEEAFEIVEGMLRRLEAMERRRKLQEIARSQDPEGERVLWSLQELDRTAPMVPFDSRDGR